MQIPKTASSSFSLSLLGPYTRLALALRPSPSYRDQRPRRTADAGPLRTQDQLVDSFPREAILFLIYTWFERGLLRWIQLLQPHLQALGTRGRVSFSMGLIFLTLLG